MSDLAAPQLAAAARRAVRVRVRGLVQGVGFRPFVVRLATELALDGCVRNDGEGVEIVAAGSAAAVDALLARLRSEAPPLARIARIEVAAAGALPPPGFHVELSVHGRVTTGIVPDAATCPDCLDELFDPADVRWRYPFINCTHCGPRFTITRALPYDRPNTSMAAFVQCPACQAEYDSLTDRRFHAQPNACPVCGPRLWLADARGRELHEGDVIAAALARIACGGILAIKGLGGFHLVCDAREADAVRTLRNRKHRDEKPFALMAANVASLAPWCEIDAAAAELLQSAARPIVLLPKRPAADQVLTGIAPGLAELGVMLPYTPLHWLLFHAAAGQPRGTAWMQQPQQQLLVMTSANPGGEPLVIDNQEAVARLGGIADAFVMHDRDVVVRCDDSVVRPRPPAPGSACRDPRAAGTGGGRDSTGDQGRAASIGLAFIRRARGYTPAPIALPADGPPVLAVGAYLKSTACLTRGGEALLSQHIGDLDNAASCVALEEAVTHLQRVLEIRPQAVAHDLHPDFFSTGLAQRLAAELGVPAIGVQHHHAHVAAVAAEHGLRGPLLGLALDGVGLGDDAQDAASAWGGELLRVDGAAFARLGHLRALPLPGGDRAAREPWRMGAAVLHLLGRGDEITRRYARQAAAPMVAQMLARGLNSPLTSSAGRWFDAAAGLLGVREAMAYEGQAAMQLEAMAAQHGSVAAAVVDDTALYRIDGGVLDLLPLLARLAGERDAAFGAALFHATLATALADWVAQAAQAGGIGTVALGGGCFLNSTLSTQLERQMHARGLAVLQARQAPPNDGGLSLGQAWVAAQRLAATQGK